MACHAVGTSSILVETATIYIEGVVVKRKLTVPKRNPFVCLVLKKTGAGTHRKSNKALRKLNKQSDRSYSGHTTSTY